MEWDRNFMMKHNGIYTCMHFPYKYVVCISQCMWFCMYFVEDADAKIPGPSCVKNWD